jgi:hypothetical protein
MGAWAEEPDDIEWEGGFHRVLILVIVWFLGHLGFGWWLLRLLSRRNSWKPKKPPTMCLALRTHGLRYSLENPCVSYKVKGD